MADIAKICQDKNQLLQYTIHELRSLIKNHDLNINGNKLKICNTNNDHRNNIISMCDRYVQWSGNVKKKEKDKKQYPYNIAPEFKVKLENEIKGKNKIFQI